MTICAHPKDQIAKNNNNQRYYEISTENITWFYYWAANITIYKIRSANG